MPAAVNPAREKTPGGRHEAAGHVYAECMAVKTITIDLESYELLAARKRPGESFSRVIKRTLRDERYTASHLLEHIDEVLLAEDTLAALETVVKERDLPDPVALEK
jgi:predicted CopG family antitoxin